MTWLTPDSPLVRCDARRCNAIVHESEAHDVGTGHYCTPCHRSHFGCIECGAVEASFVADEGRYCDGCALQLVLFVGGVADVRVVA